MKIQSHKINNIAIAEIISDDFIIQNTEDALDLIGNLYYQGYDNIILYHKNLQIEFFDLKNKMAGEILQKFSNYRLRLIIVGDYSRFKSKSLNRFIYECNNGKQINFVTSLNDALYSISY